MLPLVSLIIPCRNESRFIGRCLDSVLASTYPLDRVEILVVDGMSTDDTREIAASYQERCPSIRLFINPEQVTPSAMNIGIRASHGEFIMITGAHAELTPEYIERCVTAHSQFPADNIGGHMRIVPRDETFWGHVIVDAQTHPFGAGNAHFKRGTERVRQVDTVFGGCYRRSVFDRIGLFDERLFGSEDIELNRRLLKAGGTILMVPNIEIRYFSRADVPSFVRNQFRKGVKIVEALGTEGAVPLSVRHFVPAVFVSVLLALVSTSPLLRLARFALAVLSLVYGLASLGAAGQAARTSGDPRRILALPPLFLASHLAVGLGSLRGALSLLQRRSVPVAVPDIPARRAVAKVA